MAMTLMMTHDLIKMDCLGRLIVCREHREALLDEFERGAMSGPAFSRHHGIKYQTFASWMQKRRRARRDYEPLSDAHGPTLTKELRPSLTLAEVTMAPLPLPLRHEISPSQSLKLNLPCGLSLEVSDRLQIPLLLDLIAALPGGSSSGSPGGWPC